jgi:hypothetical protein
MGTSTTVATGRFGALARLMVALGFAATLLAGQAVVFDSPASAHKCDVRCVDQWPEHPAD